METETVLKEIGLTDGETKVYLSLLKLGSSPVSKIKEETGLHRTTIYDFIEKLLNKGLVHYVIKNNVNYYDATDPKKLIELLKEKMEHVTTILPQLQGLKGLSESDVRVEVYRGKEGYKAINNSILQTRKDYVVFGADESLFKERFGTVMEQFFKKEAELGIKERVLTSDEATFVYDMFPSTEYRYLPKEQFNPTPTFVWGNTVAIMFWEPFTVIKIENENLADSYKKHFELLWKIAKKRPKHKKTNKNL